MRISFAACKPPQPLVQSMINMDHLILPRHRRKDMVVVVMGATGTGKSRLSIDLATRFDAEIINSDKMQLYKGLNIATNKVTDEECRGVPHHLLGFVDPEADFWAHDFVHQASVAVDEITNRGRLPIIAGGSNSFIKALVNDDSEFRSKYECCFLWVDVFMPDLHAFVSGRVDEMVASGLVEEAREFFEPHGDYSRGIRRAIGVPELDEFFRAEAACVASAAEILMSAVEQIKANTRNLARRQRQNILRLAEHLEWRIHRLHATEVFQKRGGEANEAWERLVLGPSTRIVGQFLCDDRIDFIPLCRSHSPSPRPPPSLGPLVRRRLQPPPTSGTNKKILKKNHTSISSS